MGCDTVVTAISAYVLSLLLDTNETVALQKRGDQIRTSFVPDYLTSAAPENDQPIGITLNGYCDGPAGFAGRHELV